MSGGVATLQRPGGSGSFPLGGTVENAANEVKANRTEEISKESEDSSLNNKFLDKYIADLTKLEDIANPTDKKSISDLAKDIKALKGKLNRGEVVRSPEENSIARGAFTEAKNNLEKSLKERNNVLRQFKAFRNSHNASNSLDKNDSLGTINSDALPMYINAAMGDSVSRTNVVDGTPLAATDKMVESILGFEGEPYFNNPSHSVKVAMEVAAKRSAFSTLRDLNDIRRIVDTGKGIGDEKNSYDVKVSDPWPALAAGANAMWDQFGKGARRITKSSKPEDSVKFKKFIANRDIALQKLFRELGVGGIVGNIMNTIENQLANNGYIDLVTFQEILKTLNEQREGDKEGISDEIINAINDIGKKAVKAAEDDVENEDSMAIFRIIQVALVLSVVFGVPLLGPIVQIFANTIFSQGIARGAPALMLKVPGLGYVAGGMELNTAMEWIFTEAWVVSHVFELADAAILSDPGSILLGKGAVGFAGAPLISIAGAAIWAIGGYGANKTYYDKSDGLKDRAKDFDEALNNLVLKHIGEDTSKGAGGLLADDGKRMEFVKTKFGFLEKGNKVSDIIDAIDIVHNHFKDGNIDNEEIFKVFPKELFEFLEKSGFNFGEGAMDKERLARAISKALHGVGDGVDNADLVNDLSERFGLINYLKETGVGLDGSIVDNFINLTEKNIEDIRIREGDEIADKANGIDTQKSEIGIEIAEVRYVCKCNSNDFNIDESLFDFVGKDGNEAKEQSDRLNSKVSQVKEEMFERESEVIKGMIDRDGVNEAKVVDGDLLRTYNNAGTPGTSPSNPMSPSVRDRGVEHGV